MKKFAKYRLFHPQYAHVDYEQASDIILTHARARSSFAVSALAVHGLMTSLTDAKLHKAVDLIDLITVDGQPVRWALNSFYGLAMRDRVAGPILMLHLLKRANFESLAIYLYGSTAEILERLRAFIAQEYPQVHLVGWHEDRFRDATEEEDLQDIEKINASGAHIVFVGRGCPRQELWVAAHRGKINAAMIAIGAAFDYHAGLLRPTPRWLERYGLQWAHRLIQEPRRLAARYLITNSLFIYVFLKHKLIMRRPY